MFCVTSVLAMFSINRIAVSRCATLGAPGEGDWLSEDAGDFDALLAAFVAGCCSLADAGEASLACSDVEIKMRERRMLRSGKLMGWALKN
jgi:hypothetical protein